MPSSTCCLGLFSALSFFEGVSLIFVLPYAAVLLVATAWSYRLSDKRISFWQGSDGSVYFRGAVLLYLVYLVGLVARLSIELAVFGSNLIVFPPPVSLSATTLSATIATDLLLVFGLGLLIGRNARVVARYRRIERGGEHLPNSPPEIQPLFGRRGREEEDETTSVPSQPPTT